MKLLLPLILFAATLAAQPAPGKVLIERLRRMTPAERQRALDRMSPERREALERRLNSLDRIQPGVRDSLQHDFESFQKLSPQEKSEFRRTLRDISELPAERRRIVRAAIHHLRKRPPLLHERILNSRNFTERFSEDERKLIRESLRYLEPLEATDLSH